MRLQQETLERERRQAAEARQLQEDACKAQAVAYSIAIKRTRQADRSEDRLFDQFRDCIEKTRSDLNETVLLCERAARLELQHAREAAAAAERTQPTEVAPPAVS